MENINELMKGLVPDRDLSNLTAEAIVEHIAMNIYESTHVQHRDKDIFFQLPVVLQDTILILDFDTELQMSGIIGFLENSTGTYFEETIEALFRIRAMKDFKIMDNIKGLLKSRGISSMRLRENVNQLSLHQVTNTANTHGNALSETVSEIAAHAESLYLYRDDDNIFDHLFKYLEDNKANLNEYIQKIRRTNGKR